MIGKYISPFVSIGMVSLAAISLAKELVIEADAVCEMCYFDIPIVIVNDRFKGGCDYADWRDPRASQGCEDDQDSQGFSTFCGGDETLCYVS
jgi:hypothetical protein